MKKILLICTGLLALTASTAAAQIQVAWNDCLVDGGAVARVNACTSNDGINRLVVSYTPTGSIPDFTTIDGTIDINFDNGTPVPWWSFKNVGTCRMTAASINISIYSTASAGGGVCQDTWDGATSAIGLFTGYAEQYGAPFKNRAVFAIARNTWNPTSISAGTNYFGWIWEITNASTDVCSGCSDPVALFSPVMFLTGASGAVIELRGQPDDGHSCVSWNGGSCNAAPTQATTWGKVKAMYR